MSQVKVLFADDHIPDDDIPDNEIEDYIKKKYTKPKWTDDLYEYFQSAREVVNLLRESGYEVTIANTYQGALDLIQAKGSHFDAAIIDLNWKADESLPETSRSAAGWRICDALDTVAKELRIRPTPQIIRSRQFAEDPAGSIQAANKGRLPIFKSHDKASYQALRAAVKFIESLTISPTQEQMKIQDLEETRKLMNDLLRAQLKKYNLWFGLTLAFVALGLLVLLVGVISVFLGKTQIGVLTSVFSSLPTVFSYILFRQLQHIEKTVKDSGDRIERQYEEAKKQLFNNPTKS